MKFFYLAFAFLACFTNVSHADNGYLIKAEKIYQDCLKENEAETCYSGCGMIVHSCNEVKQDYIDRYKKNNIRKTKKNVSHPAGNCISTSVKSTCKKSSRLPVSGK